MKKIISYQKLLRKLLFRRLWCFLFVLILFTNSTARSLDKTIDINKGDVETDQTFCYQDSSYGDNKDLYVSEDAYVVSHSKSTDNSSGTFIQGKIYVSNSAVVYIENKDNTKKSAYKTGSALLQEKHSNNIAQSVIKKRTTAKPKPEKPSTAFAQFSTGKDSSHFSSIGNSKSVAVFAPSTSLKDKYADNIRTIFLKTQFSIQIFQIGDCYQKENSLIDWQCANAGRAPPFFFSS